MSKKKENTAAKNNEAKEKTAVPEKDINTTFSDETQRKLLKIEQNITSNLMGIKKNIWSIGRYLSQAKKILENQEGTFTKWIEETFGNELPYSTAHCYMSIYEKFQSKPEIVYQLPVHFLIQMKQESFPEEIKKMIEANPIAFSDTDLNAIKEAFKQYKAGKLKLDKFFELAKKEIDIAIEIQKGNTMARSSKRSSRITKDALVQLKELINKVIKESEKLRNYNPSISANKSNPLFNIESLPTDDKLISEIDDCIKYLNKLKDKINKEGCFFKQHIAEVDGVFQKTFAKEPAEAVASNN